MSAKPDTPPRGKCPRKCEVSAGAIAVACRAEVEAIEYGVQQATAIIRTRNAAPVPVMSLEWLEAILAGAFEDGYKRGAGGCGMKPKLTDWFPPEIKPVHPGEYDTAFCRRMQQPIATHWYRGRWWWDDIAAFPCTDQKRTWRGLAEKPS